MSWSGSITALITPFRDGRVDEQALRELVSFQIEEGIDGLVACGTTGECATLSDEEHIRVIEVVVQEAKGRVPVIAGTGSNATDHAIELSKAALDKGANGLLQVCPYYNKPTQEGLVAHFRAIAKAAPAPTMLYNVPGRTGCDLLPETLASLRDMPEFVAIKEASGSLQRVQEILNACGDRFDIFCGEDELTLGALALGAKGVVSVTSNVLPNALSELCKLAHSQRLEDARALQLRLDPLHRALFAESNPGPVKFAMAELGFCAPELRLPLVWPRESTQKRLLEELAHFEGLRRGSRAKGAVHASAATHTRSAV